MSFERPNLELAVRQRTSTDVAANLSELIAARQSGGPPEPTIVYTITRGDAENVAQVLEVRRLRWLRHALHANYNIPAQQPTAVSAAQESGFAGRVGHYHSTAADKVKVLVSLPLPCHFALSRLGLDLRSERMFFV